MGDPNRQPPPPQTSPEVQTLPSSHASVLFVDAQPVAGAQESVVHGLLSLQTVGPPGWQEPPPHVSPVVQALPSSHAAVLSACTQPVAGLHESSVQGLLSLQLIANTGLQLHPAQRF